MSRASVFLPILTPTQRKLGVNLAIPCGVRLQFRSCSSSHYRFSPTEASRLCSPEAAFLIWARPEATTFAEWELPLSVSVWEHCRLGPELRAAEWSQIARVLLLSPVGYSLLFSSLSSFLFFYFLLSFLLPPWTQRHTKRNITSTQSTSMQMLLLSSHKNISNLYIYIYKKNLQPNIITRIYWTILSPY